MFPILTEKSILVTAVLMLCFILARLHFVVFIAIMILKFVTGVKEVRVLFAK
jgi:hypothetical protein